MTKRAEAWRRRLSEAVQDYLARDLQARARGGRGVQDLDARHGRWALPPRPRPAMVKKLAALGLVDHQPYRGVRLTESRRADCPRGDPPPPAARAVPRRDARARPRRRPRTRQTASSTRCPRSSRRASTRRSAARPRTRTATRSPTCRLRIVPLGYTTADRSSSRASRRPCEQIPDRDGGAPALPGDARARPRAGRRAARRRRRSAGRSRSARAAARSRSHASSPPKSASRPSRDTGASTR